MTRVEVLEQEIQQLSRDEFSELRDWLLEEDWAKWDRQIEADAASGKLDAIFEESLAAHRAGESTEL